MIIIAGTIEIETNDREALFDAIRQMVAASQAEEGCISYYVSPDITDPDMLHLYEVWETTEHLDAHQKTPHFQTFLSDIRPSFARTNIKRYNAQLAGS